MNNDLVSLRRGELLRLVFSFLWNRLDGASIGEILTHISQSATLTAEELAQSPSLPNFANFEIHVRSAMTAVAKAGWLVKERGRWYLTDEGQLVCKDFTNAAEFYTESQKIYQEWLLNRPSFQIALEYAEEMAWGQIQQYLKSLPYQSFRGLIEHLIQAMGYHITWMAPLHKQRGTIDMLVFPDPLGMQQPRMVVHIQQAEQAMTVESLTGSLAAVGGNDVLLLVSKAGFTHEARDLVVQETLTNVFLVDLESFYDLWMEHYEKLPWEAHQAFPLKAIHFLALDE